MSCVFPPDGFVYLPPLEGVGEPPPAPSDYEVSPDGLLVSLEGDSVPDDVVVPPDGLFGLELPPGGVEEVPPSAPLMVYLCHSKMMVYLLMWQFQVLYFLLIVYLDPYYLRRSPITTTWCR